MPNEQSKPYTWYGTHPRILTLGRNNNTDVLEQKSNGSVLFKPCMKHDLPFSKIEIPKQNNINIISHTTFGLLDDLVPGSDLMEKFLKEHEAFVKEEIVYYPYKNHLVRFAPRFWHRIALLIRNSTLLRDKNMELSWQDIRNKFEKTVVAVAGCSIGSNMSYAIAGDLRPLHMKVADYKEFHITNGNRVRLSYEDFGRNKAQVVAEYLNAADPFMKISVYSEGIHQDNIADFVAGNLDRSEPPASIIIEETDDPDIKILIRETARKHRIPIIMGTDLGSIVQIDVRRFDRDDKLSLATCGVPDDEVFRNRDLWQKDMASRDKFLDFAFALIGKNYKFSPELKKLVNKDEPPLFAGNPQLGSTALAAAGVVAEITARLVLGFPLPERMTINKFTGKVLMEGEKM